MGEESHVDAMRAAIRGDFERLERRRGTQELMRVVEPAPSPDVTSEAHAAPDPLSEPAPGQPRRWLDRLLSR